MGLLAHALRPSGSTHDRPPYSSRLNVGDVVPMVPDLVRYHENSLMGITLSLEFWRYKRHKVEASEKVLCQMTHSNVLI
jgi:hypothetical protein